MQPVFIDPLEFARGALCAASFVATVATRETHVTKLRNLFEQVDLAASMADALGTMQFLRERRAAGRASGAVGRAPRAGAPDPWVCTGRHVGPGGGGASVCWIG